MQLDTNLFTKYQLLTPQKNKSERGDFIDEFTRKLNLEREGTKYKPITKKAVAVKLGKIPTEDLYYLMNICKQGKSFGKVFFGSLKPKWQNKKHNNLTAY